MKRNANMKRVIYVLAFCLILGAFLGCRSKHDDLLGKPSIGPPVRQDVRIKIADVSNKTGELFDVDAIGMLWNGLEESLKGKGLLWSKTSSVPPLTLNAQIVQYKKGNMPMRAFLPGFGKTVLAVKCELLRDGQTVATAEARHSVSMGSGTYTIGAWKKIFGDVSQDVVEQLLKKI
jgi:hypothetical protein